MQDIDKDIASKYDLDIRNITPFKDVFILNTQKGKKILRKSSLPGDRILFIHRAKEHLCNNGFTNVDRFICTLDDQPYITIDESNYTLNDIVEGDECNFDNKKDVIGASKLLAGLHKASIGFKPAEDCKPKDDLGKLPGYFSKRLDEIKKLKKVAKKGKTKFDYMFLEHFDYFNFLGENSIELISESNYDKLVIEAKEAGIICHHDFTHHNILCSGDRFSVINFDYCCFELKVYDLANLIRRKMRKCNWNINEAKVIVDSYRTVENLSDEDMFVMKIMLQFPQKFWRVINKYYNSKRSWSEKSYVAKLQEVVDEIEHHKTFMENYDILL